MQFPSVHAALCALSLSFPVFAQAPAAPSQPPAVAPRTIADITAALEQYKPDAAKLAETTARAAAAPPATGDKAALINFYRERAQARDATGMFSELLEDRRKLVELAAGERALPLFTNQLAATELALGNVVIAAGIFDKMARAAGSPPPVRRTAAYQSAFIYARLGDRANTAASIELGDSIFQQTQKLPVWNVFRTFYAATREWARAGQLTAEGKFVEAEAAFRRTVAYFAEDLTVAEARFKATGTTAPELIHAAHDASERDLAIALARLGRLPEAELAMRNTLMRTLTRTGRYSPATASNAGRFANLLVQQGRFREAAQMAQATLEILDKIGASRNSALRAFPMKALADSLFAREDWPGAHAQYEAIRVWAEADELNRRAIRGYPESAMAYVKAGAAKSVVERVKESVANYTSSYGPNHYQTGESRGAYAMALDAIGDKTAALREYREALRVLLAPAAAGTENEGLALRRLKLRHIIDGYIALLWESRGTPLEKQAGDVVAESFRVAEASRGGSLQQSLAASAARSAATTPGLGELIRTEQDERQELQALYDALLRLSALPPEQQLPKVMADMRSRIAQIDKNRANFFATIEKRFPDYANLIHPRPSTPAEAAKALRPGEALVSVLSTKERSYIWTVNARGQTQWHATALGEPEIARIVAKLRTTLDPGDVALSALPAFDFDGAHRLYTELLAPSRAVWDGADTLVTTVSGALGQIPLAILPTEKIVPAKLPGAMFGEMRSVPWLARKIAVTDIPSATALVRLRALPPASAKREAFAGFGDPQFGAVAAASGATRGAVRLRNLSISRVTEAVAAPASSTPAPSAPAADGWTSYGDLSPLPDTREEILSIAQALGADRSRDVFLGMDANKKKVRDADLSRRRIVAFATHGLIPGDLPGLTQPALALSAFSDPNESPLLTLDDVLSLKLDADLVVLSACNTAAGDGVGAEAVSGLGRAFFYAGSRALLVTHWPVETVSARLLTTGLFERYAKDPKISRARALNESIRALMEQDSGGSASFSYAHPMFWAPYALVGDGGR
jgi:CHAT domain-containing protein